ncbi:MAG: hypothetical protein O2895_02735 [Chloroflexi bacterium]|nr:hypothetical protein [Chloroflexota bacterium]
MHHPLAAGATCLDGGLARRWSHLADYGEGALARWSPDGAHLLVQWPSGGIGWSEE